MRRILVLLLLPLGGLAAADPPTYLEAGLAALRARQRADGRWTGVDPNAAVGTTAQALLAFLGVGALQRTTPAAYPMRRAALEAIAYLMEARTLPGPIGNSALHVVRDQSFAALALLQAADDANRADWRAAGLASLDWMAAHQSPEGHWRHLEPEGTDARADWSLVTLLALRQGLRAAPTRENLVTAARRAEDELASRPLADAAGAATGAILAARRWKGQADTPEFAAAFARQVAAAATLDSQGLLHTTLASFDFAPRNADWKAWNRPLRDVLIGPRRPLEGEALRSWPAEPELGEDGHEVSVIALRLICLEIYNRYPRALIGGAR